jgi:hypothetical protein
MTTTAATKFEMFQLYGTGLWFVRNRETGTESRAFPKPAAKRILKALTG